MQIEHGKVVTFFYQLSEDTGAVLEDNREQMPLAYLHGHRNLLPALEAALAGKQPGESVSVSLAPSEAYGERKGNMTQRVPVKHLLSRPKRLQPGMVVRVQTERDPVTARVIKAGKFTVDVDFNHPFAGKSLKFDITVDQVRDATSEELMHGHAHGPGGHHH